MEGRDLSKPPKLEFSIPNPNRGRPHDLLPMSNGSGLVSKNGVNEVNLTLVTITSVLDGSWMLSGGSITQDCTFVVGKMCHSYSSETPLRPWIIIKSSGSVVYGHCTCKAGQGETWSDVKAVLSWLKTNARIID